MRKTLILLLAITLIFGSFTSFAADGDIIHTGLKKIYKAGTSDITSDLINDVTNNISNPGFLGQYYREKTIDGKIKYINVVDEENAHLVYLRSLVKDPTDLEKYIRDNAATVEAALETKTNDIAKTFDEILDKNKGNIEDYIGSSSARKLKNPDNYSTPIPGVGDNTTRIMKLTRPSGIGATKWIYKIVNTPTTLKPNDVIDGQSYTAQTDIPISDGKYLLLCATDKDNKVKAYDNIAITANMIKVPRVTVDEDNTIEANFMASVKKSGATVVSGLPNGTWKLAVLDAEIDKVYEDSRFVDSMDYIDGMDLVVASDDEVDSMPADFKKAILIYSAESGKIKKYKVFSVSNDKISGALDAKKLSEDNYSTPVKGNISGATRIAKLSGLDSFGATKWMYTFVEGTDIVPKLDRVYTDSVSYEVGQDIIVETKYLMILATDNDGKVKAYGIVELKDDMVKESLAKELTRITNYTDPVKGSEVGTTKIGYLNPVGIPGEVVTWKYVINSSEIDVPELNSSRIYDGDILVNTDINIGTETELKVNDFQRNMMIYGLDSSGKIKAYKKFVLDSSSVKMPTADLLVKGTSVPANYSEPKKGNGSNTTRIEFLEHTGLTSTVFKYKLVDNETHPDFNEKIEGTQEIRVNIDRPTTAGKYLLLLAVDSFNRTKAYANIPLSYDTNVKAGSALKLTITTNYKEPVPGSSYESTKFTYLNLPSGASKWIYKIGDTSFGIPEAGSKVTGYTEYTPYNEIVNVSTGKYLILFAVDSNDKIISYIEFRLIDSQVKGREGVQLETPNYTVMKGDKPGTSRLKLEPLGFENPASIRWRYQLTDDSTKKPYTNEVISDSILYNINSTTGLGGDINVINGKSPYKYILILATDTSGKIQKYKYVELNSSNVREFAPAIEGIVFSEGNGIDTVKVTGNGTLKYLITNSQPNTPAIGDLLPTGVVDYISGEDIRIKIGQYLSIYEVDGTNKIMRYSSTQITSVNQGKANLSGDALLEGNIKNGGSKFTITLNDATWVNDITSNKPIRDKLFNGFKANSESIEWSKVIASMIADGKGAISVNSNILTILLPQTLDYDIKEEQKISLVIPPEAIDGALNSITATGTITIKPTISATISGDVVNSIVRQSDIKAGGKTIVVELADGIWADDVNGIINGFSGGENWDLIADKVRTSGTITRNSGTKITITLPMVDVDFDINSEVISLKIPKSLIQDTTGDVVASPHFTLYPDILKVEGEAIKDELDGDIPVVLMAPDYRVVDAKSDTWIIDVTSGTLKSTINNSDVIITGLPKGLVATVSKVDSTKIGIKISGTASTTLSNNIEIKVKVKGTAVTEPNSIDSNEIGFKLIKGNSLMDELTKVKINVVDKKLENTNSQMQYSLNSTNGTTGDWYDSSSGTDTTIPDGFKAGKVYVRDKDNHKVFHLVATLSHGKAPTGINISEVNYDSTDTTVKLSGFEIGKDYEYSTDGGNTWMNIEPTTEIILLSESDLRVRFKATESNLPSLATAKISLLSLKNVTMNVGEGKILGTTTAMEYSLNDGETYTTAKANETPVSFIKDRKVIIREKAKPLNMHTLGTVDIVPSPSTTNVSFNILAGTITDTEKRGLQYRIEADSWKDLSSTETSTVVAFKQGKLEIRAKGTTGSLPSEPVELAIIVSPASAPELIVDDFTKDIMYWNGSSEIPLENSTLLEYKINDGIWQNSSNWATDKVTSTIKNGNPKVSLRIKATTNTLPSLIKVVNFTGNLTFENVKLNVVEGKIDGTTTAMEYSLNSTDGKNGTWIDAKANSTTVTFIQGMKVYIREKSKPLNFAELSGGIGAETNIATDDFSYSIVDGSITNKYTNRILEYKMGVEPWKSIDRSKTIYGVKFEPGALQIRARGTETTLPSPIVTRTINAKSSAPELKYDDVNYTIEKIGLGGDSAYEYNINGGTWIPGTVDTQFEGSNVVLVRLKATEDSLPSLEQKIVFTNNLYLGNVILNAGRLQLENTSTLMEYSLDSNNGEDGLWFQCTATSTPISLKEGMTVHIREKSKPRNIRKVTVNPVAVRPFADGESFVNSNLDYNILERTISIQNIADGHQDIVNGLQYRIGDGNWTNIDYVDLGNGATSKVLVYNVNFVPGNLEFRLRGNENQLPSRSIFKDTILASASAPHVSIGFDTFKYKNIVDGDVTNLEYSFGENGPWIDGVHLSTEDLVGKVYFRIKAKKDTLPSLIKTLEFTPVLNLKTIILSTYVQPLELNGTTDQMEYNIYLTNGNNTGWINCSNGNTKMPDWLYDSVNTTNSFVKLEIRDKNQPKNKIQVYPQP